ncbi:MAG: hypothetical protein HQ509_11285 [Candidatus Marinimicrobia bacterium]|nr:hypothetical protein [Candidatus Neomarinimicrobiota bacterium]
MNKSLSEQLGSAFAHIQDLMDTVFHSIFKVGKNRGESKSHDKVAKEFGKFGDSYYKTYSDIKSKEEKLK